MTISEDTGPEGTGPARAGVQPDGPEGRDSRRRRLSRGVIEWVAVIVVALLAAFLVKTFVLQTFYIPSASMEPTLDIGDRVFVNKLSYDFHSVRRGDIVVFTLPPGESAGPDINDLIKRVIGLPGETIQSIGNRIYINGKVLPEPWLPAGTILGPPVPRQVIPAGHYFLMGDNRSNSRDSRYFQAIPSDLIVGRAFVRIWPFSRLGFL